jgi:hypothetical protein
MNRNGKADLLGFTHRMAALRVRPTFECSKSKIKNTSISITYVYMCTQFKPERMKQHLQHYKDNPRGGASVCPLSGLLDYSGAISSIDFNQ